jgi:hypothetical protein
MSQEKTYNLLKELGGTATQKEIATLAKKKYPEDTLYQYIGGPLHKLEKWGCLQRTKNAKKQNVWTIIAKLR